MTRCGASNDAMKRGKGEKKKTVFVLMFKKGALCGFAWRVCTPHVTLEASCEGQLPRLVLETRLAGTSSRGALTRGPTPQTVHPLTGGITGSGTERDSMRDDSEVGGARALCWLIGRQLTASLAPTFLRSGETRTHENIVAIAVGTSTVCQSFVERRGPQSQGILQVSLSNRACALSEAQFVASLSLKLSLLCLGHTVFTLTS